MSEMAITSNYSNCVVPDSFCSIPTIISAWWLAESTSINPKQDRKLKLVKNLKLSCRGLEIKLLSHIIWWNNFAAAVPVKEAVRWKENLKALKDKVSGTIVNRGEWLWNSSKFFVVCYCSVFWPWPCTKHNSCLIWIGELTNRNVFVT